MIWLAWRQFRTQAAVVGAAAGALAIALLVTGGGLEDLSAETGSGFLSNLASGGGETTLLTLGSVAVLALPAVIGVFWGAPLVARELEAGTHRLAWNQTVTRTRWLTTRMGVTALAAVAVAALVGLALAWWCKPIDAAILSGQQAEGILGRSRMEPPMFSARGIVPAGYAAFALALGVATGAVVRRPVPAMAITLAVFVGVQIAVPALIRGHVAPTSVTTTITTDNFRSLSASVDPSGKTAPSARELRIGIDKPGAWIVANETLSPSGAVVDELPSWMSTCLPPPPSGGQEGAGDRPTRRPAGADPIAPCLERLTAEGYRQRVTYQPASRFWSFQALETGAFLGLAGLLTGFAFWWVRRLA